MSSPTRRPQAIITGGSRGIGRACCLQLAQNGFDIAFTYRTETPQLHSLIEELRANGAQQVKGYISDFSQSETIDAVFEKILQDFPNPEVFVSNTGISLDGLVLRFKPEDYDRLFETNLKSAFFATQSVLRPMMKQRKGSIIYIGSVIGEKGNTGQAVYAMTKAALSGLMKSLAQEVGSRGIRVNLISPGFIETDMTSGLPEQYKEDILNRIPLARLGTAHDVAHAVSFLSSSSSQYITGQVLSVNGGLYM